MRSAAEQDLERQLTVLVTAERLTRERELFVLERQRMDLLSAEKELQGMRESTFWSGSYLLDARLIAMGFQWIPSRWMHGSVPPRGGSSVDISIRGPRANISGIIEQLAAKILEV